MVLEKVDAGLQATLQGRDENSREIDLVDVLLHSLGLKNSHGMQVRVEVSRI